MNDIESFIHGISQCAESFFAVLAKGEGTISKVLNCILDKKGIKIDDDCSGFCDAEDIFILVLFCEDAENLTENLSLIMKVIKKEQRTFKNLVNALNKACENNINNCKSFLTIEKVNEIINLSTEFLEENDEI